MVLVQAEEQRPLRREAMKPGSGKPGDIQTLGKTASTWEWTVDQYYMVGGQKEAFFEKQTNNDSAPKKGVLSNE